MNQPYDRIELPDTLGHLRPACVMQRVQRHLAVEVPRYRRLWRYYRNALTPCLTPGESDLSLRPYRQAQEWGLPARLTGSAAQGVQRKEIVIENDIAWRVDAMVDFLFGKPIELRSLAPQESRRRQIEAQLREILSGNGGLGFLQKLALLGAVYGFVDVLVKLQPEGTCPADACGAHACDTPLLGATGADAGVDADLQWLARRIRFEIVEPARALPLASQTDPAQAAAHAQVYRLPRESQPAAPARWMRWLGAADTNDIASQRTIVELITPRCWQRFEDGRLVEQGGNALGRLPLVHIQNAALPFEYAGLSDVEPMLPLQDELNTRLSDRAGRITMQSYKMYLGKGIEDFANLPVGPGRMWSTDNPQAEIVELGGDSACPSEESHIAEIREALDKVSGVSPIAAGAVKGRIGRLSSAAALRVTLLALLNRTERKRNTYGPAMAQMCELALAWLDRAGLLATDPAERVVQINWPSPVPESELEKIGLETLRQTKAQK
jgi:hypothetical protein